MPSPWEAVGLETDPLARARELQRSWERLLAEGGLGPELPPDATAGLRPTIVESWRRSLVTGLDPVDLAPPIEAEQSEVRERWLEHPLGQLELVLAAQLREVAEETRSLVVVTDASGLLLHLDGPEWLKERAREMNFLEGGRFSEAADGTNGIGTALAADHALQVFAFEHFNQAHHQWVCSGAPVHDPVSGKTVGLIDLTSLWKIAHPRSLELVSAAARTMERCLLDSRREQDARLRRRYGDLMTRSTDLLVNGDGYVLGGNDPGRTTPHDVPRDGGEIVLEDGSLAIAEPLGHGEAYLVRRSAPGGRKPARVGVLERAEEHLRELAMEQAALRQVATLVARESSPDQLFAVVAEQAAALFDVPLVRLVRFEPEGSVVVGFSKRDDEPFPAGSRWPVDTHGVLASVRQSGRPARIDDYSRVPGQAAALVRLAGIRSAVASPIVVARRLWGAMVVGRSRPEPLPADTEARLTDFTELVATAIANAQSLAELTASEARKTAVLEWALDCIITIDREGRILEWNPAAEATFGYRREEVLGKEMAELIIPPSLREQHNRGLKRYLETGEGPVLRKRVELQGLRSDGTEFPIELTVTPVTAAGLPIFTAFVRDITHQKQSEEERVRLLRGEREARAEAEAASERARNLAREQAALRRIATLVAEGATADELFSVVAREVGDVLGAPLVNVHRYELEGGSPIVVTVASLNDPATWVGRRWPLDGPSVSALIRETGWPVRIEDFGGLDSTLARSTRAVGARWVVGAPIIVDGSAWGNICAWTTGDEPIPDNAESRLADFTDLVATSVSSATMRAELAASEARAQGLAGEQAALRRVASLVAHAPSSGELFSAVAREVATVLNVPGVLVERFEPDGAVATVGAAAGPDLAGTKPVSLQLIAVGTRMPRDPGSLAAHVFESHGTARVDDYSALPGKVGDAARAAGLGSGVAGPILVDGELWGQMCVFSRAGTVLPGGIENRLHDFTELVATAIGNAESRAAVGRLVDEQAALRRVATLVARGVSPEAIFSAVSNEMGRLFGSPQAYVGRFAPDGLAMVVVGVSEGIRGVSIGSRWELEDYMASTGVHRTRRSVRFERSDFEDVSGPMAEVLREIGAVSYVGAPIVVEGQQWGFVTVTAIDERLPPDAERRLEKFAELLGTAIANADSRAELAASRARIIAAGDDARRRIERDLHDGAQQRLVTLTVALRRAKAKIPARSDELRADLTRVAEGLTTAVEELRELSRGIHPSILTEGGLLPALRALGRRSPVRVKLDMGVEQRLPDHVEVAAYYTVSEALTNASKHAEATRVWVSVRIDDAAMLLLSIRDDGAGGADATRGSGLAGLRDRIEALGGKIQIDSPPGSGTLIEVEIPIAGPADRNGEPDEHLERATTSGSPG